MLQPVNETLKGTEAVYVNVNNYAQEVKNSNRPVMVLFYGNDNGSKGLGALAASIKYKFPTIKLCVFNMNYDKSISGKEFTEKFSIYGLKKAPSLFFYKKVADGVKYIDEISIDGGYDTLKDIKSDILFYARNIPFNLIN